ncbi:MAG: riboflavin synthase, partial [Gemmatimonadota bacterium]
MFTGIVEEVGRIGEVEPLEGGRRMRIEAETVRDGLAPGDSVAVDGACLTVAALEPAGFAVEAIGTTLSRTTLGEFESGRRVNLERALALGARVGGHLVQGHVDGRGRIVRTERFEEHALLIDVELPDRVSEVTVLHGSIAINGVSLTVNARPAPSVAQVALIPYTWEHTNLAELEPGAPVNVEGDLIGRFVVDYLKRTAVARAAAAGTTPARADAPAPASTPGAMPGATPGATP